MALCVIVIVIVIVVLMELSCSGVAPASERMRGPELAARSFAAREGITTTGRTKKDKNIQQQGFANGHPLNY
jgi:hypothetical protein